MLLMFCRRSGEGGGTEWSFVARGTGSRYIYMCRLDISSTSCFGCERASAIWTFVQNVFGTRVTRWIWGAVGAWIITKVRDGVESDLDLWDSLWGCPSVTDTNKLLTLCGNISFRADIHTCRLCRPRKTAQQRAASRWRNDGNSKWGPFKDLRQHFYFSKTSAVSDKSVEIECQNRLFLLSQPFW